MNYIDYSLRVGTKIPIKVYTGITLTGYTRVSIMVKKPIDYTQDPPVSEEVEWTGTIDSTAEFGNKYISYTLQTGDIDLVGTYLYKSRVRNGTVDPNTHIDSCTIEIFGDINKFEVLDDWDSDR
jgi:hypothetical protein